MEPKRARPGASAPGHDLSCADKQIQVLCDKLLPPIPHLLSVPTKTPYMPKFPHENQNTPFEQWEVMQLQYMTLITEGDRGVGFARGNWQEDMNAKSPFSAEAQSSVTTPNPVKESRKPPAVKLSIADYKNFKTTGVKPSPRASATTPESRPRNETTDRPAHSRNVSAVSVTPMARVPSIEGDQRTNSASSAVKPKTHLVEEGPAPARLPRPENPTEKPSTALNGHHAREPIQPKDANKDTRAPVRPTVQQPPLKYALPPRPQSPQRHSQEIKQQKRSLESGDALHPEKRTKLDHIDSRTPSASQKPALRKPETSEPKLLTSKPQKQPTSSRESPQPKKVTPNSMKPVDTKGHSSKSSTSEKPLHLPPLLSPLPADLGTSPQPQVESARKSGSEKVTPPKTPQKSKGVAADTIVVKQPHAKSDVSPRPTASKSPPFILPPLLSPDLPEIVEAELHRLQQKSAATLNTVEARHEKVRQPGAPGVAQKRPKIGHPPKKTPAESSNSAKKAVEIEPDEPQTLLVRIPYKKKIGKIIDQLERLSSNNLAKAQREAARRVERSSAALSGREDSESEDVPLASTRATKAPTSAPSRSRPSDPIELNEQTPLSTKKRPIDPSEQIRSAPTSANKRPRESSDNEPAAKKARGPEKIDTAKASTPLAPAFKSPTLHGPSEKSLLATPKKGDAMKSVAMHRVNSNDGHARTPQATSTSTPASAEKSKSKPFQINDETQYNRAQADDAKFYPLGTAHKRELQAMLVRDKDEVTEEERKTAIMRGVEGLMAYMMAFHARDKQSLFSNKNPTPNHWEELFPIYNFVLVQARGHNELMITVDQLGAIARHELSKIYNDFPNVNVGKMTSNNKEMDRLWDKGKRSQNILRELGIIEILGPWNTVNDAVGFGLAVLEKYASAHGIKTWKGDVNFTKGFFNRYAKPYMKP